MTRKRRRLWLLLSCLAGLGSATGLSLAAFQKEIVFFATPSDLLAHAEPGRAIRLGGLVEAGSLRRAADGGAPVARFRVTDGHGAVPVTFAGILPDLFREGQGVVALGRLRPDGTFDATEVLAKHDESYMPRDVAEALKRSGRWRPEDGKPPPAATWNLPPATANGSSGG